MRDYRILGLLMLVTSLANATEPLPALDRVSLGLGAFSNRLHISGRIDGQAEFDGSTRDFDETLDIGNRHSIGLYEAAWRFADHHQLELRRYSDQRSHSVRLDESLSFNGDTFPVQAELHGSAGFTLLEGAYTYWSRIETETPIGVQFGVLRLDGRVALRGRIEVPEEGEADGESSVREHLYAPLVGLAFRHLAGERWRLLAEARLIRLRINGITGHAYSARVGVEYFPHPNLGLTLQYGSARVAAEQRKRDLAGELEIGFDGPQLLLRWRY